MDSYKARPLSRKNIRKITRLIRESIGISDEEAFPVIPFLESALAKFGYNYDICEEEELRDNYALTIPSKKILKIREDVYLRAMNNVPRDLFTISHEFGHAFLHDNDTIALARGEEKIKAYEDPEWQANTFAAELMAPSDAVRGMSIEEIMRKYNCSKQVAEIQSHNSYI